MDTDPDIPVPSVEHDGLAPSAATKPEFTQIRQQTQSSDGYARDSSPSRTPFKTPRSRPGTPSSKSLSRSSSVASLRGEQAQPALDKRRSIPNLNTGRNSTPSQPQFRRASSILNPATPTRSKSAASSPPVERPKLTAAGVAKDFFKKDLAGHNNRSSTTVVFTHDSCYGHRYARPKSSKAQLASIVERPERIHATLLGVSSAYVRLGQRHKDGNNAPHPDTDCDNLDQPPFLIRKSTRSVPLHHPAVTHVHGTKWMEELQIMCDTAEAKLAMNGKELTRPIGYGKDDKGVNLPTLHTGDLYLAAESLDALQGCLGSVCDAIDTVFSSEETRRAFVCIRPPGHHCSSNMPSGFCWLNNVHVGIMYATMSHGLTHAAIIDFDLHHGDGSQSITWAHNHNAQNLAKNAAAHKKIPIGYYSVHDINSYPCEMGDQDKVRNASTCLSNAHGQSIWNVHLESWKSPQDFWQIYETKYKVLIDKARIFLQSHSERLRLAGVEPRAAIFLSSGFDASEWESEFMQRHMVNVPTDFYARFTTDVVDLANESGNGVDGRVVSVLEGGYSDRALTSGVLSHLCGLSTASEAAHSSAQPNYVQESLSRHSDATKVVSDPSWWEKDNLEWLEAVVAGRVPTIPNKSNDKMPGSYSSPTQASTARMTDTARERTSLSAKLEAKLFLEAQPPEPPPEVDWATASYQLSRLLIPTDRQTLSCTHEELNAEATKARRARISDISMDAPVAADNKIQLRDRKAKVAAPKPAPAAARTSNRRTTIAAVADLPDPGMRSAAADRPRRRSSAGSSVLSSFQDLKLEDEQQAANAQTVSGPQAKVTQDLSGGIPVKKTRAPPKRPVSRTNSPRKAKSTARTNITSSLEGNSAADSRPSTGRSSGNRTTPELNGIDSLTDGMKKINIRLKMPTEEQHNANQRVSEATKQQKDKIPRKPAIPRAAKPKLSTKSAPGAAAKVAGSDENKNKSQATMPQRPESLIQANKHPLNDRSTDMTSIRSPSEQSKVADNNTRDISSNSALSDMSNYRSSDTASEVRYETTHKPIANNDTVPTVSVNKHEDGDAVPYPMLPHLVSQGSTETGPTASTTHHSPTEQDATTKSESVPQSKIPIYDRVTLVGAESSIWDIPDTPAR